MPQVVYSLPYVAWMLLATLAFGCFGFVALTRGLSDATRGYLGFGAFCAGLLALLALAVDTGLPATSDLVIQPAPALLAGFRQAVLIVFALTALGYPLALRSTSATMLVGGVGVIAAVTGLAAAALGWAPSAADAVPLLVQLVVLSLATGGALAATVLGHWYLVTPKISERPLILQTRLLLTIVALQLLLFVTWTTLGGGPGQAAFDAFTGGALVLVVLRLAVTLLFPLALSYMAWRTAHTRSMESATGLLYINLAAVMAGTIGAAAVYVSGGLLV